MRPQHQLVLGGTTGPVEERGDCFRACVATLLEVDAATMPNFCAAWPSDEWAKRTNEYLAERFGLVIVSLADRAWAPHDLLSITSGMGPRGHMHSTIYNGDGLVFDPHPSGAGLKTVREHEFFVAADPARWASEVRRG